VDVDLSNPNKRADIPDMCFSATASFSAAAVIGTIGIATLGRAAERHGRWFVPFALFPSLFAAQQIVEGLLWLELKRPEAGPLRTELVHIFLGYAEIFWSVFAPLAILLIERNAWRRRLIAACLAVGVSLSTYLLVQMILNPYVAVIADGHIAYRSNYRYPTGIEVPYVIATSVSLLLSSRWAVQVLALIILAGFAVAFVSFHHSYISVWCFFATVASVLVYLEVRIAGRLESRRTT
jgi:Family of unknown function (DUF6629)